MSHCNAEMHIGEGLEAEVFPEHQLSEAKSRQKRFSSCGQGHGWASKFDFPCQGSRAKAFIALSTFPMVTCVEVCAKLATKHKVVEIGSNSNGFAQWVKRSLKCKNF